MSRYRGTYGYHLLLQRCRHPGLIAREVRVSLHSGKQLPCRRWHMWVRSMWVTSSILNVGGTHLARCLIQNHTGRAEMPAFRGFRPAAILAEHEQEDAHVLVVADRRHDLEFAHACARELQALMRSTPCGWGRGGARARTQSRHGADRARMSRATHRQRATCMAEGKYAWPDTLCACADRMAVAC